MLENGEIKTAWCSLIMCSSFSLENDHILGSFADIPLYHPDNFAVSNCSFLRVDFWVQPSTKLPFMVFVHMGIMGVLLRDYLGDDGGSQPFNRRPY